MPPTILRIIIATVTLDAITAFVIPLAALPTSTPMVLHEEYL
jgi:hypothetical protein